MALAVSLADRESACGFPTQPCRRSFDDVEALDAIRTDDFQSEIVKPYMAGRFEAGARL